MLERNEQPRERVWRHTALPLRAVTIEGGFWRDRVDVVRTVTLPRQYEMLERTGRLAILRGEWRPGQGIQPHIFWDSDVAKWIEAASYSLVVEYNGELDAKLDEVIALLAAAQQDDGYLNTYFTAVRPGERWADLRDAHELYCAGHLIEAGVAHYEATGKRALLDVVSRYADHIAATFGTDPRQKRGYPGHEEIELALVKLFRLTGERRYLNLAAYFVNERGRRPFYFDREEAERGTTGYFGETPPFDRREAEPERFREYNQSHLPVRQQSRAVGHAVRAMYLFSGATDVAGEMGDAPLAAACERLWRSVTTRQMYLTGGLGASHQIEGFTNDFDLPNDSAYAETCASIGLVLWAHRMALLTGESRFVDVLERALYNAVLSGMSLDGERYFYGNPLASDGGIERRPWFDVACCPPNVARLLTSLARYVYAVASDELVVNLYVNSRVTTEINGQAVTVRQYGDLPWDGRVTLEILADDPAYFTLSLRVPGWTHEPAVRLHNEATEASPDEDGYIRLTRLWRNGDRVTLDCPMPPHRVYAHPRVRDDIGLVAIARGPLVYCLEQVDHDDDVRALALPRSATLTTLPRAHLGHVPIGASATRPSEDGWNDDLYRGEAPHQERSDVIAVPYFLWNNRGTARMRVWTREWAGE
jgi:DUF1680 family protein